jgi:arylsulfatase A-like enzyme
VVFTSDNGGERFSDTWPFSGKKSELLEGGLRIPVIVRWPGHAPAGTTSEQVVITMDWLPTLLAAAGGKVDPRFPSDGVNLVPLIQGGKPQPRTLCWRYLNLDQEACRDGDFKYLKILDETFLFNVVEDPLERANLKELMPEKFSELRQKFDEWDEQMLPLNPEAHTSGFTGAQMPDHFGIESTITHSGKGTN